MWYVIIVSVIIVIVTTDDTLLSCSMTCHPLLTVYMVKWCVKWWMCWPDEQMGADVLLLICYPILLNINHSQAYLNYWNPLLIEETLIGIIFCLDLSTASLLCLFIRCVWQLYLVSLFSHRYTQITFVSFTFWVHRSIQFHLFRGKKI